MFEREINLGGSIDCTTADVGKISAINCTSEIDGNPRPSERLRELVDHSLSGASKRAYRADLEHFRVCGGTFPSSPEAIAEYVAAMADQFKPATIARRLVSIGKAHRIAGHGNPCQSEIVKATVRGVRRTKGTAQRQAQALVRDDLFAILDRLGNRSKDVRDRAMLLLGFATAMRRSEVVALNVEDIGFIAKGALVTVRRSKTDQEARGRTIAVPHGRTRHCPISALNDWLALAGIDAGPIFLAVNKHGHILGERISGEAVSNMIKARAVDAGYDPTAFSGHSLRAGFATAAAVAGASTYKIRQTTGHRSDASLARYIRDADLFDDAAIARVL